MVERMEAMMSASTRPSPRARPPEEIVVAELVERHGDEMVGGAVPLDARRREQPRDERPQREILVVPGVVGRDPGADEVVVIEHRRRTEDERRDEMQERDDADGWGDGPPAMRQQ